MIEIRIHGRGGQGGVTSSEILAIATFHDGKYSQSFPKFGPERAGAPVEAYCRIDDKPIDIRSNIYEPDYLIILDDTLIKTIDITRGLKENGVIVINSKNKIKLNNFKVFNINATKIALDILGKPIVNTSVLGAFAKATKLVSLEGLEKGIKEKFYGEIAIKNIKAIEKAYELMK